MDKIRTTFVKFDTLLNFINNAEDAGEEQPQEETNDSED